MNTSVCLELTCYELVSHPGVVQKTLIRLTLQKLEISAGSMGHLACKGFSWLSLVIFEQNGLKILLLSSQILS